MEESTRQDFGEVVSNVDRCVDLFEEEQVAFHPVPQRKVFDVNTMSVGCSFLGVSHRGTSVIVFVGDSGSFVWYGQVPQNTTYTKSIIRPTLHATTNSASVEDNATMGWILV